MDSGTIFAFLDAMQRIKCKVLYEVVQKYNFKNIRAILAALLLLPVGHEQFIEHCDQWD